MNTSATQLEPQEIIAFCREWHSHLDSLEGKVDTNDLALARMVVQPDNFGSGQGRLRPDRDLARYDLLGIFVPVPDVADDELLLICRLTREEIARATAEDEGFIPDPEDYSGRLDRLRLGLAILGYST